MRLETMGHKTGDVLMSLRERHRYTEKEWARIKRRERDSTRDGEWLAKRRFRREPGRIEYDRAQLEDMGYEVHLSECGKMLYFTHRNATIRLWPYTGWFSGKTVIDDRGVDILLEQLRRDQEQDNE